jgi:8-amino-7-oxononanoate synthase
VITDFTSSLFLGLRHAYVDLPPWGGLTTGRPPQLDVGAGGGLTRRLASLLGTGDAVLRRSTLHGLLDTIVALAGGGGTVVMDDAAYPISHWAAAAASNWGVGVARYRHHDADDAAARCRRATRPTVVLTDGWCSSCSRPAPLRDLQAVADHNQGYLVVDDSLAAGVLGERSADSGPFGKGGAGLGPWLGITEPGAVLVASLAKGFGTPLTVIAGPRPTIRAIRLKSETPVHASGPTAADRSALRFVSDVPPRILDGRRDHLGRLTTDLRVRLRRHGLRPVGLPFPFMLAEPDQDAVALAAALAAHGCRVLALRRRCQPRRGASVIGLALRADHTRRDLNRIDQALLAVTPVPGRLETA